MSNVEPIYFVITATLLIILGICIVFTDLKNDSETCEKIILAIFAWPIGVLIILLVVFGICVCYPFKFIFKLLGGKVKRVDRWW